MQFLLRRNHLALWAPQKSGFDSQGRLQNSSLHAADFNFYLQVNTTHHGTLFHHHQKKLSSPFNIVIRLSSVFEKEFIFSFGDVSLLLLPLIFHLLFIYSCLCRKCDEKLFPENNHIIKPLIRHFFLPKSYLKSSRCSETTRHSSYQ